MLAIIHQILYVHPAFFLGHVYNCDEHNYNSFGSYDIIYTSMKLSLDGGGIGVTDSIKLR